MTRRVTSLALLLLLAFAVTTPLFAQEGVPETRYQRLQRGVNITRWFWNPEELDYPADHAITYMSDEQLAEIRATGFLHVRLPIEPTRLVDVNEPGVIDSQLLAELDQAVERMNAHDLAVIIDPHNWEEPWFDQLINDTAKQTAFVEMWRTLATHLATTDPEMVFLEVMNEPMTDADDWLPLQTEVVAAMRASAPEHTIIVGGPHWNSIDGLFQIEPLDDPNIIYNFHFYEPWIFTHQGAAWTGDAGLVRGLPYPSSWWNGCDYLPRFGGQVDEWVQDYCYGNVWEDWRIDERIRLAHNWAQQHGVRIMANEFGVMPTAPYDSRLRWFRATVSAFERYGVGWTLWGYDDLFGLAYNSLGFMDRGVLQMLDMNYPPVP